MTLHARTWPLYLSLILGSQFLGAAETNKAQSCENRLENLCDTLYAPPRFGNWDFKAGAVEQKLRFGKTENDINYSNFIFLEELLKKIPALPSDMREAINKNDFPKELRKFLKRKPRSQLDVSDIHETTWTRDIFEPLDRVLNQVAFARTEHAYPGFIRQPNEDTPSHLNQEYARRLDLAWTELSVIIWKDHPLWIDTQKQFETIRKEYLTVIGEDKSISEKLRKLWISDLQSLKLVIPGSNPRKVTGVHHWCGINEANAFYDPLEHQLTICAGLFVGASPVQTIAHETGHALGISRRLVNYLDQNTLSNTLYKLWDGIIAGTHLSCADWAKVKKSLRSELTNLKPYVYEDDAQLKPFVTKTLLPIPKGKELRAIAEKLARKTMRSEVDDGYIQNLLKRDEILQTNRVVRNATYLRPDLYQRWPLRQFILDDPGSQFELAFVEEFNCLIHEKKVPETQAIEKSIIESQSIIALTWQTLLRFGGPYSSTTEAVDEGFSQDIEEDVVDAYASRVYANILKKVANTEDRWGHYFGSIAIHCDAPSFLQRYPDDAQVLRKFSNRPHSIGKARRLKLLSPEIRAALECK